MEGGNRIPIARLKALFLVATLKPNSEISNTLTLAEFLAKHLESYETETKIIRLNDFDIRPGTYTNVASDDWLQIFEQIMTADIIIFATPVWWDNHSSLIQRAIERLDEIHDEIMDSGKSRLTNKVAGIIVTGDSDGAQHIIGNMANFFITLGLTIPPFGTLTVLWPGLAKKSDKSRQEILNYFEDTYSYTAKKTAQNITFMANLLKNNPLPE
jgi:multimeric flavodoxin WrbA